MQETNLYTAIYHLASIKEMTKNLTVQPKHIYVWIKGVGRIPFEYALQVNSLSDAEILLMPALKKKTFLANLCSILHKFILKMRESDIN